MVHLTQMTWQTWLKPIPYYMQPTIYKDDQAQKLLILDASEVFPNLNGIYSALDEETSSQFSVIYGNEEFAAPLGGLAKCHWTPSAWRWGRKKYHKSILHSFWMTLISASISQTHHIHKWLHLQQEYLDKFICADGLGDSGQTTLCIHYRKNEGNMKCQDCFGHGLYCTDCIVSIHKFLPLHQIILSSLLITFF